MRKLIDYATTFDPTFPSRIRGASQQEIARLEQLAGPPLPSFYREYLALMGHGDDDLIGREEPNTDISRLISFYEENVATGEDPAPADCIFIGVAGCAMDDIAIERGEHGRVFEIDYGEKDTLWADSLEKLLYRNIYTIYRPRQFPYDAFYSNANKKPSVATASAEAIRLGFKSQWFSDSVKFCAERDDAVLILSQLQDRGLWMRVAAANRKTPDEIARRLATVTGVEIERND